MIVVNWTLVVPIMKIQIKTRNGETIELSGRQLKTLAQAGKIKPDTVLLVDGKEVVASRIKGLSFAEGFISASSPGGQRYREFRRFCDGSRLG